ncbi:MAG: FIST C-terminal domain-containing protein [Georgfuchsia sp.]
MRIATGFAANDHALPDLAAIAVKDALACAGSEYAHSLILLLSGHFARHAQPAVSAASRAANCIQVSGCTVPGLFTEKAWALDQPAAAALVLCDSVSLGLPRNDDVRLSLVQPSHTNAAWIADGQQRFGTLATDGEGETEGQVWTQGKVADSGRIETALHGGQLRIGVSRGIQALTPPLEVTDSDSFEILQLGEESALDSLLRHLDPDIRQLDTMPPQRIFAALPESGIDPVAALKDGRYTLLPILRVNRDERSVTLAAPLPLHSILWWVLRDPVSAEHDMNATVARLATESGAAPAFGLMFSCIGRGPYFYQGHDRDTALVCEQFPGMPLIGAYSAGEIAPVGQRSSLISYSSVLALVSAHV